MYWQAIVAPILVVLQQGEDVAFDDDLCDGAVASPTARRDNVLESKCEAPIVPFPLPPFLNVPDKRHPPTRKPEFRDGHVADPLGAPELEGREPPLTLRRKKNHYLYFGRFFPCAPGPFSCSTGLFLYYSHRAGPVLQEFRLVLRVGVRHSTSVLRHLPWG